jgi:hypothetical protein
MYICGFCLAEEFQSTACSKSLVFNIDTFASKGRKDVT